VSRNRGKPENGKSEGSGEVCKTATGKCSVLGTKVRRGGIPLYS